MNILQVSCTYGSNKERTNKGFSILAHYIGLNVHFDVKSLRVSRLSFISNLFIVRR